MNNDFEIYHKLHSVKDLICNYPSGAELTQEINALLDRMSSRLYRVVVIGEFKKG